MMVRIPGTTFSDNVVEVDWEKNQEKVITDQEQIKSKLDELIRRLEYFNRDYQNVPLQLAKDIRDLVIGEQLAQDKS